MGLCLITAMLRKKIARHVRDARRGERPQPEWNPATPPPPIRQEYKRLIYLVSWPFHQINGFLYRHFRAPRTGVVKVQVGPGKRSYFKGWVNLDGNMFTGTCDVWVNFHNPLPFPDNSVDLVYSYMVVEHLRDPFFHFQEMHRVLKPGGIFRVGVPNADTAIRKYVEKDKSWFWDFPDVRTSLGGKFNNFIFCREEHLSITTFDFLEEMAERAGFKEYHHCRSGLDTKYPELIEPYVLETEYEGNRQDPYSHVIEGRKDSAPAKSA